jgi:serine/threonine protein kinase
MEQLASATPLPEKTVLHTRYTLGPVTGTPTPFLISYAAFDTTKHKKVLIRELFPANLVIRSEDGKQVVVNDHDNTTKFAAIVKKFLSQAKDFPIISSDAVFSGVEVFQEMGTAYQVTDFVTGIPLPSYLNKRGAKLPPDEAAAFLVPVLQGLAEVHESNLIHGAIHPAAFRIEKDGDQFRLVLMNLGISPKEDPKIDPGYLAPELTDATKATVASEIYAMTGVAHYLLTGEAPPANVAGNTSVILPFIDALEGEISPILKEAVYKGLNPNPTERFPSASDLLKALQVASAPPGGDDPSDEIASELSLEEAGEDLFEGVETVDEGEAVPKSSNRNKKVLWSLIIGTIIIFAIPAIFIYISVKQVSDSADSALDDLVQQMEQMEEYHPQADVSEEPEELDPGSLTQREQEVQQLMQAGNQSLSTGDPQSAIGLFKRASVLTPNNPEVFTSLGTAYTMAEQSNDAVAAFEKVIRLDPQNAAAYGNLGRIFFDSDRQIRSWKYFKKAVELGDLNSTEFVRSLAQAGNSEAQKILTNNNMNW